MKFRLRSVLTLLLALATAGVAAATCNIAQQLSNLQEAPTRCSQSQLGRLEKVLVDRLRFREDLDLPLATRVLQERKCPSADEFKAFFDAWRELPRTGITFTVQQYCLTEPTFYMIRFPSPDKPLDDAAAASLSVAIDRLRNSLIPALASKEAVVERAAASASSIAAR
jgi:hypothetical protein